MTSIFEMTKDRLIDLLKKLGMIGTTVAVPVVTNAVSDKINIPWIFIIGIVACAVLLFFLFR